MKKYNVIIIETFKKTVEVEANNRYEALKNVSEKYQGGQIAIIDEDYKDTEIYAEGNDED